MRDADHEGRRRGVEGTHFQARSRLAVEALWDQRYASGCFDRGDEARGAVVLFTDLRAPFQWREKPRKPGVIFWVFGNRIRYESFTDDLLNADLARPRQGMCRVHRHAHGVTAQLIKIQTGQPLD